MQLYMLYSRELSERAPDNADYLLELSYAYGNLGSVSLAQNRPDEALEEFRKGLAIGEPLSAKSPSDYDLAFNLADTRSWVGTTLLELGRLAEGRGEFAKAVAVMRPFHQAAQDKRASYNYSRLLILQSESDINRGEVDEARRALEESLVVCRKLLDNDPSNTTWRYNALRAEIDLLSLIPPGDWTAKEHADLKRIELQLAESPGNDSSDKDYIRLKFRVYLLRNVGLLHQHDTEAALRAAEHSWTEWQTTKRGKTMTPEFMLIEATVQESLGKAHDAAGNASRAREIWQVEAARLHATHSGNLSLLAVRRLLAIDLRQTGSAEDIEARLNKAGYRDPRMEPTYAPSGPVH
jgi:tetratricopeptide (TPR) repeat protein